jgi:hypothetical protein
MTLFIMNNEQSPICQNHPWVGGGPCLVNVVARRLNGGGSWVGGGPCLVNAVARRLNSGSSWVGELVGVADVIKG